MNNKKAKKSFCPRASTGNTHHGMRYAGEKLFSNANVQKSGIKTIPNGIFTTMVTLSTISEA